MGLNVKIWKKFYVQDDAYLINVQKVIKKIIEKNKMKKQNDVKLYMGYFNKFYFNEIFFNDFFTF